MVESFNKGLSFDEFLNKSDEDDRNKTLEMYENIKLDDDLIKSIMNIKNEINILACAEMWCPDCVINLPALKKMKDLNDNINISTIKRDGYENEFEKIPTFIIYDEKFNKLGRFIERPITIKEVEKTGTQPEIIVAKKKYRKGEYITDTIKDIINIINLKGE
ncbi:MAG: thioredoxin family protein [Senegalia sp. (in: firmicutes)]|uniref:thioredoxin family protein n=1 Tax=Senegalia sp. (in: firmicutes) TaxID=1924098 RepID=UPI003F9D977A